MYIYIYIYIYVYIYIYIIYILYIYIYIYIYIYGHSKLVSSAGQPDLEATGLRDTEAARPLAAAAAEEATERPGEGQ